MKQLFVSYELALKAKKAGFDEPCIAYHLWDGLDINKEFKDKISNFVFHAGAGKNNTEYSKSKHISAPMYHQLIDWLRNEHGIQLFLDYTYYDGFHYGYRWAMANGAYGQWWKDNDGESADGWDTPEEALNYALNEAFKLIK